MISKCGIMQIKRFIDNQIQFNGRLSVNEITQKFKISRYWLGKLFKKNCQTTPHEYIKQQELIYWNKFLLNKREEQFKNIIPQIKIPRSTYYRRIQKYIYNATEKDLKKSSYTP